ETVVVLGAAKVQLADRCDLLARVAQTMHPARDTAIVNDGIVPATVLMDVAASRDAGPSRAADRTRRIGIGKARTAPGNPLKYRRAHDRISVASKRIASVIVRLKEDQILRPSHSLLPCRRYLRSIRKR